MLKQMYVLLIVLLAILLASCATTYKLGKHYATENVSQIVIGETTEKDVVALFGSPWKTGLLNGYIVYNYCYAEIVFYHDDSVEKNGNTLKVPHMGWNKVELKTPHPVFKDVTRGSEFYFVHSYFPAPKNEATIIGTTDYGISFTSALGYKNLIAVQFHPEKSGKPGLTILKNFCEATFQNQ